MDIRFDGAAERKRAGPGPDDHYRGDRGGRRGAGAPRTASVVPRGRLTWSAEGHDTGRFATRRLHWPGGPSGVTVGRGYDMGRRTAAEVTEDLTRAGVPAHAAAALASGAGLTGEDARLFVALRGGDSYVLTREEEARLFTDVTYPRYESDVRRLCEKYDVVSRYGATDWDAMHPVVREVLVDLHYRGDYTKRAREILQPAVAAGDAAGFAAAVADRANWPGVQTDRFRRRAEAVKDLAPGRP